MSTIPQIQVTNHFTLYQDELCITPLSMTNWPQMRMFSAVCVVSFFDYQYSDFVCLIIDIVKAELIFKHNCQNKKKDFFLIFHSIFMILSSLLDQMSCGIAQHQTHTPVQSTPLE